MWRPECAMRWSAVQPRARCRGPAPRRARAARLNVASDRGKRAGGWKVQGNAPRTREAEGFGRRGRPPLHLLLSFSAPGHPLTTHVPRMRPPLARAARGASKLGRRRPREDSRPRARTRAHRAHLLNEDRREFLRGGAAARHPRPVQQKPRRPLRRRWFAAISFV